jgi:hypothetical protein
MKTFNATLLFAILMLSIQQESFAIIRRVNLLSNYNGSTLWGDNVGGTAAQPVYKQINTAIAAIGLNIADTIHVEGAANPYEEFTIPAFMPIIIIGAGYFLNENPQTSNNQLSTRVYGNTYILGAGARVQGIHFINAQTLWVQASNVIVERCMIDGALGLDNLSLSNIIIRRNYFANATNSNITHSTAATGQPSGTIISNNIFKGKITFNPVMTISQFNNNVLDPVGNSVSVAYTILTNEFKNNIYKNPVMTLSITSTNISHNITPSNMPASWNSNIVLNSAQMISELFVDPANYSTDGDFQLKPGYANGNFGSNDTQRGAFGGSTPYELSGIGPIPVVYDVIIPNVATPGTGLQVTISSQVVD